MVKNPSTNQIGQCLINKKSERLHPLYTYVEDMKNQIKASASAVYVIQEDRVIGEWYSGFNPLTKQKIEEDSRFNIYSARKSYIGLAVAILLNDGKINSLDDEVLEYVEGIDENIYKGITLRHLVTHTHGLKFINDKLIRSASPGSEWIYNDAGLSLLYKIILSISHHTVNGILQDYVFNPLEFSETGWESTYKNNLVADVFELSEEPKIRLDNDTGFERNLYVSAREFAHWGYLHLNKGNLHGKQVLPRNLFEFTTSIQTPKDMFHTPQNGFFWFKNENAYLNSEIGEDLPAKSYQILGISGCACLVIPEYKVVAVRMYNKIGDPAEYDYLRDIKNFGNLVSSLCN
ncbi:serine hydrolase [Gracilibacillus salitolerans]|uniref:Serine hydrolase n=1 Tax=Gracilibacillus salitolerans TaxID=2663022 RepID=A0A5Q2TDL8_9BACI|nr:serine hydrolase domain-containing protein [Gracilibacillus salitolerans]QGH32814.1 serine hydrolase [Gracilibacillus salitolerans]